MHTMGSSERALQDAQQAIMLNPTDSDAHNTYGNILNAIGDTLLAAM
jgi:Flp pilus assembly protein TadD